MACLSPLQLAVISSFSSLKQDLQKNLWPGICNFARCRHFACTVLASEILKHLRWVAPSQMWIHRYSLRLHSYWTALEASLAALGGDNESSQMRKYLMDFFSEQLQPTPPFLWFPFNFGGRGSEIWIKFSQSWRSLCHFFLNNNESDSNCPQTSD